MSSQLIANKAYVNAQHTVQKSRQVVMLYDGAIRFAKQAKEAIEQKKIEERYNLLVRVSDIMQGLQSCLDFENGGEAAVSLYDFYSSIYARIIDIQRSNDAVMCESLIADLKKMRDFWDVIDKGDEISSAAEGNSSPQIVASGVIKTPYPINEKPDDLSVILASNIVV